MDEISPYWQVLGHSSNGFWAYLSSYAFVLSEVDLCAEGKEALHECVSGEIVLSQLGVSERPYLPAGALGFHLVGSSLLVLIFALQMVHASRIAKLSESREGAKVWTSTESTPSARDVSSAELPL